MELKTPEELQWISNVAHWIEGGMFGVVGLIALVQALGYAESKSAQYLWPGLILIAGIFLPAYILLQRGFDGIGITWNLVIRDPQQREHFLMALLMLAIGAVETLIRKEILRSEAWKFVSPAALVLIGVLLLFHTEYGTAEAIAEAAQKHAYLGIVILLAGLFKAAEVHWRSKFKWLAFPWIVLLLVAALLLITYREPPGAYKTIRTDRQAITTSTFARSINHSLHIHTGGASMRRIAGLLTLLTVAVFWAGCTTTDNTNTNVNTTVTASPSPVASPAANSNMGNMNASEHANMNMNGNMNHNMNANKKP